MEQDSVIKLFAELTPGQRDEVLGMVSGMLEALPPAGGGADDMLRARLEAFSLGYRAHTPH